MFNQMFFAFIESEVTVPLGALALPAIIGASAITFRQYKKGDSVINCVGKILIGVTTGIYLCQFIAAKFGLSPQGAAAIGGLCSPVVSAIVDNKVRSVKDSKQSDELEGDK